MTKRLFILRHAKSSWDDPGLDDHERPLAPRGQRAVKALAEYVRAQQIEPALVLCSSARRTRETLDGVAPGGEWLIEDALYGIGADGLLDRLRQVPEESASVMVIGHNPTLQVLILRLAGHRGATGEVASADSPDLAEVRRKFPTGALATLTFEGAWSELAPGQSSLTALVRPRQLPQT